MLNQWIRIFSIDNTVATDITLATQDKNAYTAIPMVYNEDYVYIGQELPFNQLFMEVKAANTASSVLSVEVWNGSWDSVAETIDGTSSAGKTLAVSGNVQFTLDKNSSWLYLPDTSEAGATFGLTGVKLYNLYWARIKVSASLSAGTQIRRISYKFTTDDKLEELDPNLDTYRTAWDSTKTEWLDQILDASSRIAEHFKTSGIISGIQGVLRIDSTIFTATAYRALSLVYSGLGKEYADAKKDALGEYNGLLEGFKLKLDANADGVVNDQASAVSYGRLIR